MHLNYNPELQNIPGLKERFWDCVIVDGFINNNDRNDGNWGILRSKSEQILAPVFDNGSSFSPNVSESKIKMRLQDENAFAQAALNGRSAYSLDNKRQAFFSEILRADIPEIQQAITRVVPNIDAHMQDIQMLIRGSPEKAVPYTIISPERKAEYCNELSYRHEKMLLPALDRAQEITRNQRNRDLDWER